MSIMILVAALFLILVIGVFVSVSVNNTNKETRSTEQRSQGDYIRANNICVSADYTYATILNDKKIRVVVDDVHNNIYISKTSSSFIKHAYSEITGCEVVEDSQVTGGITRAVVGGILAGDTGAIIGAATAKPYIMSYKIIIFLNSVVTPRTELVLINKKTSKKDQDYIRAVTFAEQITATIRSVVNKGINPTEPPTKVDTDHERKKLILDDSFNKLHAIKAARERFGMNLAEAETYVESYISNFGDSGVIRDGISLEDAQRLAEEFAEINIPTKIVDCD